VPAGRRSASRSGVACSWSGLREAGWWGPAAEVDVSPCQRCHLAPPPAREIGKGCGVRKPVRQVPRRAAKSASSRKSSRRAPPPHLPQPDAWGGRPPSGLSDRRRPMSGRLRSARASLVPWPRARRLAFASTNGAAESLRSTCSAATRRLATGREATAPSAARLPEPGGSLPPDPAARM
jgi:hypothetical protein